MANSKEELLFSQFPPISTEQWEAVIAADLKGADYEKKLVWKTEEGFNVQPYYRAENLEGIKYLGTKSGEFPYVRGTKPNNNWLIHQTIAVENPVNANKHAQDALMRGTESIGFRIDDKEFSAADLDTLLKGIYLGAVETTFTGCAAKKAAHLFLEKAAGDESIPKNVKVNFVIDPVINKLTLKGKICSKGGEKCFANLAELVKKGKDYPNIRFVGVNGQVFQNSGSTIVQELAFTLAAGHEYAAKLMGAGLTVDEAAKSMRFTMAISANYFMEIAKFRAARMLWANIIKQYNPECAESEKMKIHGETSRWNETVYDPYVNMLRGTTEAMSGTIAGVDTLEVLPFNDPYEAPTEFSSRIARNVQLLLKKESHFDQVADPAGGSYYIEVLTNSIAEQAWNLFREVEAKGGYMAALEVGFIQEKVEASAAGKDKNIATRRQILLGTNQYPNFLEVAGDAVTESTVAPGGKCACTCGAAEGGNSSEADSVKVLKPYRGAMAFERMRLQVDRSGKEFKAFMLTCGNLAMARARAQFACNFFACAGIRVQDNTYFQSVEEGVKAALEAKADIVVICASDDDYATLAPEAYKMLGGKALFAVAGAPASQPDLEAAGIKNFISVRSNVLETLKGYLKELGV